LAPSDFPLFGLLKSHLGGKHFADDRGWNSGVEVAKTTALIKWWDKCINVGGGYVKK
jgi:hypothetical protein